MATLIIPDDMPLAQLATIANAMGKRVQYRPEPNHKPAAKDIPNGSHRSVTGDQRVVRMADRKRNHRKDA